MSEIVTTTSKVPEFVQDKLKTLEGALVYASTLCKSKVLPAHFYERGADGKPDYNKAKPEAVVVVLQYGQEIGMTHMQALQQLVPVNNLVSIKGDGAKALIMGSGKVKDWKEEEIGKQGEDSWGFKITVTRKDTNETASSTFTVFDAKRASLWIDDAAIQRNQGLRHSPWHRFPRRMLRYRALGFMARDMFSDVLQGVHIEEEIDNTINVDAKIVTTDTGLKADLNKADNTEARTNEVLKTVEEKLPPIKTAPTRKPEKPKPEIEEAKVVEETPTQPEPSIGEKLNTMTPVEIGNLLKEKVPFSGTLFDRGLKKNIQTAKQLLIAESKGVSELELVLEGLGVEFRDLMFPDAGAKEDSPFEEDEKSDDAPATITGSAIEFGNAPRDMIKCAEIADYFEEKGIDLEIIAEKAGKDLVQYVADATKEELEAALNG